MNTPQSLSLSKWEKLFNRQPLSPATSLFVQLEKEIFPSQVMTEYRCDDLNQKNFGNTQLIFSIP